METEFKIFGRAASENESIVNRVCNKSHVWISFYDTDSNCCRLAPSIYRADTLFLSFDDCERSEIWYGKKLMPISDEQAKAIVDFVYKWKDKVAMICVNCEAGISRSSGAALALSELINGHDSEIRSNPNYFPNPKVRESILKQGKILATEKTPKWFEEFWQEKL